MEHSITGEPSWHMDNFDLEATDVQVSMRNFLGVQEDTYYDMEDMRNGDWSGTTDTDYESHDHEHESKTHDQSRSPGTEGGYSKVNQTPGKENHWSFEASSKRMGDQLNKKPKGKIIDPLKKGKKRGS